jgi:predicted dehydrogenase
MEKFAQIKLGFLGGGANSLIGQMHRIAALMHERYQLVGGVFSSNFDCSLAHAMSLDIPQNRVYDTVDSLISGEMRLSASERMAVVAVLTPNALHFDAVKKLLSTGFHVICEKPMTTTVEDALTLQSLVEQTGKVFCVTHTYTGYPMVRQMRELIARGLIGDIQRIDAQYLQGWLNPIVKDDQKRANTWRLDPAVSGSSWCFGDIGIHAFNLVEFVSGLSVKSVLADLHSGERSNHLDVDGTALLRIGTDVRGSIRASQIATGEENNLSISIYGNRGGLKWEQENPNRLVHLPEEEPSQIYTPGNMYLGALARSSTKLPAGHPEGLFDAMANIYSGVASAIHGDATSPGSFPTIEDGVRGVRFVAASVASNLRGQQWVDL